MASCPLAGGSRWPPTAWVVVRSRACECSVDRLVLLYRTLLPRVEDLLERAERRERRVPQTPRRSASGMLGSRRANRPASALPSIGAGGWRWTEING
jgi:hypothetical protein